MKLKLPAKLAATFLLAASFFSYAEFECVPLAGTTQFMSMSGGSGCPQRSFKVVGSSQCEVVLHEPQCTGVEGEWFGTYRYTGSVFQPENSNPIYTELNQMAWLGRSATCEASDETCRRMSNQVLFNFQDLGKELVKLSQNDNVINTNVRTLSDRISSLSTYVDAAKVSSDSAKLAADSVKAVADSVLLQTQLNSDSLARIENTMLTASDIQSPLDSLAQDVKTNVSDNLLVTSNAILNSIESNTDDVLLAVDDVKNQVLSVQNQLYDPLTREAKHNELLQASNQAAWNAEDAYNRINSTREIVRDVEDLSEQILQTLQDGSSGGGGSDMSETNDLLDDIRMDAKSASISAEIQRQAISDQLNTFTDSANNNALSLSQQLGQQLSGIQSAIENGSGGGGVTDDDTETNEKLDGLGQKLDGIQDSLDGFTDTTGMAQQLNDSVTNTNAELSTEMDTMFEGFGTEEKMDQLESTVSGMVSDSGLSDYDSVDKVRNSLSEATTISQIFDVSRASCSPYQFWEQEINFCPAAQKSSMVLEYFIWALTAIFAFLHITGFLSKLRTE